MPIQSIKTDHKEIYLSFDDGPCPSTTPEVLKLLKQHNAKATFFVVGERALENSELIKKILEEGHSIGDHSLDHRYYHFFCSKNHLKQWVLESQQLIEKRWNVKPVGFRSPAGIRTPPLSQALKELNIPWIHWQHRFYDTQFQFSENRFHKKIDKIQSGDIILLHDRQREDYRPLFLESLSVFVSQLHDKGFDFRPLSVEKIGYAKK